VTTLLVPYFLDEYLPLFEVPLGVDDTVLADFGDLPDVPDPGESGVSGVSGVSGETGDGPAGVALWRRLGRLNAEVAAAVASTLAGGLAGGLAGTAANPGRSPVDPPPGTVTVACADCTTSLGIMAGLQRAGVDPAVVWFDAHGDVQTMETTGSGFLGGMPLRVLAGYRPELIATGLGLRPVPEERIVLVGARDLDPPEVAYLDRAGIRRCEAADLTDRLLPPGPLYLHLDFDVVDPVELPGVRYPAPGGPGLDAVAAALRRVLRTGRVVGFGVACTWGPGDPGSARLPAMLAGLLADWIRPG
jgi:arginase